MFWGRDLKLSGLATGRAMRLLGNGATYGGGARAMGILWADELAGSG